MPVGPAPGCQCYTLFRNLNLHPGPVAPKEARDSLGCARRLSGGKLEPLRLAAQSHWKLLTSSSEWTGSPADAPRHPAERPPEPLGHRVVRVRVTGRRIRGPPPRPGPGPLPDRSSLRVWTRDTTDRGPAGAAPGGALGTMQSVSLPVTGLRQP